MLPLVMRQLFLCQIQLKASSLQDVFYTDLRDPSAIDLTRPIFDWLQNSEEAQEKWEYIINGELQKKQKAVLGEASVSHLPRFASVEMHKIRFCDISFQLGARYLYCHQVPSFFCHGLFV